MKRVIVATLSMAMATLFGLPALALTNALRANISKQ